MISTISQDDVLRLELRERVLWATINRSAVRNAVNAPLHGALARLFADTERRDDVDVLVITGAGSAFCAGGDLDYLREMTENPAAFVQSLEEARTIILGILDLSKPLVARVNGDAIGLGATIALMSDVIVAAEDANIADPHVRIGLVAGDGGAIIWPSLIGIARAKEFLLLGAAVSGKRAAEIGLVNHAVPSAELDRRVEEIVSQLARGAQPALKYTKRLLNMELQRVALQMLDASLAYENLSQLSADHHTKVRRLLEKADSQH